MKKLALFLAAALMMLTLASCQNDNGEEPTDTTEAVTTEVPSDTTATEPETSGEDVTASVNDPLDKVMDSVLNGLDISFAIMNEPVSEERFQWYLFVDPIEGAQAYFSEAMMTTSPHSIVLLRVPEGSDAQAVQDSIIEKLDPRKWICVGAEATAVERRDNLILVALSTAKLVTGAVENFNNLK